MMTREEAIKQLDGAELMLLNRKYELFQQAYIMAINALHSQQEHFREVTKKVKPLCYDDGKCHYKGECGHKAPLTNADRIRAMSDEEIAEYVCRNSINTLCDIICGGECNAIATLKKSGDWACKENVMKWLQQPAEED